MSHCFPPAPFALSHLLTLRASRPCRPRPLTPLIRSFPRSSVAAATLTVHLARSHSSIETRSLPTLTRCFPRSFTFYVAPPTLSLVEDLQAALAQFAEIANDL